MCQENFFNQAYWVKRRQALANTHDRGLGPVKIQLLHPKKVESKVVSVVLYLRSYERPTGFFAPLLRLQRTCLRH